MKKKHLRFDWYITTILHYYIMARLIEWWQLNRDYTELRPLKKKYITDFFLKEKSKLADPLEKLIDSLTTDSSSSLDALTVGPAWSGTNLKGKVSG